MTLFRSLRGLVTFAILIAFALLQNAGDAFAGAERLETGSSECSIPRIDADKKALEEIENSSGSAAYSKFIGSHSGTAQASIDLGAQAIFAIGGGAGAAAQACIDKMVNPCAFKEAFLCAEKLQRDFTGNKRALKEMALGVEGYVYHISLAWWASQACAHNGGGCIGGDALRKKNGDMLTSAVAKANKLGLQKRYQGNDDDSPTPTGSGNETGGGGEDGGKPGGSSSASVGGKADGVKGGQPGGKVGGAGTQPPSGGSD